MKRHQKLVLAGAMVLILVLAAAQGRRVRHLRESEAFYRWMLAAAVNERLFQDESGQYKDKELFDQCNTASQSLAALAPAAPAATAMSMSRNVGLTRDVIWLLVAKLPTTGSQEDSA